MKGLIIKFSPFFTEKQKVFAEREELFYTGNFYWHCSGPSKWLQGQTAAPVHGVPIKELKSCSQASYTPSAVWLWYNPLLLKLKPSFTSFLPPCYEAYTVGRKLFLKKEKNKSPWVSYRCMSTAAPSLHHCDTSLSTPPASRAADGRRLPHPPQDVHHWRPQQTLHDMCLLKRSSNASSQYTHPYGPCLTCRLTTTAMTKIWQGIKGILVHQNRKWSFCCCWKFITNPT